MPKHWNAETSKNAKLSKNAETLKNAEIPKNVESPQNAKLPKNNHRVYSLGLVDLCSRPLTTGTSGQCACLKFRQSEFDPYIKVYSVLCCLK